jgi:cupin superfamily acireductone dioxygenase involved in methionine salvage
MELSFDQRLVLALLPDQNRTHRSIYDRFRTEKARQLEQILRNEESDDVKHNLAHLLCDLFEEHSFAANELTLLVEGDPFYVQKAQDNIFRLKLEHNTVLNLLMTKMSAASVGKINATWETL